MNECPVFLKMTPDERFEMCKQRRVCVKCTRGAHAVEDCRYLGKCFLCQGNHHSFLHCQKTIDEERKGTTEGAVAAA